MRQEVSEYLKVRPKCFKIIKALSATFEATYATDKKINNTEISVFLLKPKQEIKDSFGLNYEILAVYSAFPSVQPRIMQAIEHILDQEPAKGRVDRIIIIIISDDKDIRAWERQYSMDHPDARIMIPIYSRDLYSAVDARLFINSLLRDRLYHADLFDYRLPLNTDAFYFGRSAELSKITGAIDRGENVGIFGLRKTGKTSFLFKLRRTLHDSGKTELFYYDCKLPEIRSLKWADFILKICRDVSQRLQIRWKQPATLVDTIDLLRTLIARSKKKIILAFDEIEFISPNAVLDTHWSRDFVDFWQTIWGIQSQQRKVVAIISGVIPKVIETERYSGVQNPLFSIVKIHYLRGFPGPDVMSMVTTIGGKVGIKFDQGSIDYLLERFGGHPYLIRLACSNLLENLDIQQKPRPFQLTRDFLAAGQDIREKNLLPYIRHIVAELQDFYPVEYEVLELLSADQYKEYYELAVEPEFVEHLKQYGIVTEKSGHDEIAIPVAKKFIAKEYAKKNGRKYAIEVIDPPHRQQWLLSQTKAILGDLRTLADHFRRVKSKPFLPVGGVPEADRLISAPVAIDEHSFSSFFIVANRCLVESIEAFLKEKGVPSPIYDYLPKILPKLSTALQRIKIYRHDSGHLELSDPKAIALRSNFLAEDLGGRQRNSVEDVHFVLQQCAIDALMNGIQAELVASRLA